MEQQISDKVKAAESKSCGAKFKFYLFNVTVEPVIFFNLLAVSIYGLVESAGLYEVICIQNYQYNSSIDCTNISSQPDLENHVQADASRLTMGLSLAYFLPAIVSDLFLGAYSDIAGRKINIILGMSGLIISILPYAIIFTNKHTPLKILLLTNLIAGITGFVAIVMISSLAYLSDIESDKSKLTIRMSHLLIASQAALIIGSFSAGPMTESLSPTAIVAICLTILAAGILYTAVRIKQVPPLEMKRRVAKKVKDEGNISDYGLDNGSESKLDSEVSTISSGLVQKKTCCQSNTQTLKFIAEMYTDVFRTFSKVRQGRRRLHLNLMVIVYLLYFVSEMGLFHGTIINLFAYRSPFNWTLTEMGNWKGTQAVLLLLGNVLGSVVMKIKFKFKETTTMLICMGSVIVSLIVISVSKSDWMLYVALLLGMLGNLTVASMKSFVAQLVEPDEVGKAFAAQGVTADVAFVLSAICFNSIYTATVSSFPGMVFLFAAALVAVCVVIVTFIHVDRRKTEPLDQNTNDTNKPVLMLH